MSCALQRRLMRQRLLRAGGADLRQRAMWASNFIDVYLRRGWIPPMLAAGATPGMEAAGTRD
jgi:NADPH:quinone reductase-like Zn-dependent oxidoreductase